MTQDECSRLLTLIAARYSTSKLWEQDAALTARVWHMSLADVPYDVAEAVLQVWFRTQKWAPDPSEIRGMAADRLLDLPEPEEAWGIARGAIACYYPGHPFSYAMPEPVRKALHAIGGLHTLKMSESPGRDREAFIKAYTIYRRREMETAVLDAPAIEAPKLRVLS